MSYQDIYTTKLGEMWDEISHRVYGDERYVPELMAANPTHRETVRFEGGVRLVCPDIPVSRATPLPAWKTG